MVFKKIFIIFWLFISQVILSQVNQDISFTIKQDTLFFMGNDNINDCFYSNYFTNNVILKIKNNTNKKKFIPINFIELNFAGKLKTETEDIKKYREVFFDSTFLTSVVNILDENNDLIAIDERRQCLHIGINNIIDYQEPIQPKIDLDNCLMLINKFDEKDSLSVPSYDESQIYLFNNFIALEAYQEIQIDFNMTLNRYFDGRYLNLDRNKTYSLQMFYFNYEEFKENISPRILDYFDKKGYKMWTGEVQSNTVKLISFDRLKCCK